MNDILPEGVRIVLALKRVIEDAGDAEDAYSMLALRRAGVELQKALRAKGGAGKPVTRTRRRAMARAAGELVGAIADLLVEIRETDDGENPAVVVHLEEFATELAF